MTTKLHLAAVPLVAAAALALGACGGDDSSSTASGTAAPKITATDVWARVTAPSQKTGAVYMTLESDTADALTGASVPASVAGDAALHKTTTSMDAGSSGEMDGMSSMKAVASLPLPAGTSVVLKPGGFHIMLMDLAKPIATGDTVPVTLTFQKAGTVKVDAVARPN